MNTTENTNTKINEYSVYLSELVKGTPYEQDFVNIDSFTADNLIIKIKALILKTKSMIRNTKPDTDVESINKLYSDEETMLEFIQKQPDIHKQKNIFLIQEIYKYVLGTYLFNEGMCNRVQNTRNEELLKALQKSGTHICKAQEQIHKKIKPTKKQLEVVQKYIEGYNTKQEIADELNIKVTSVRSREQNLLSKLNVGTMMQAVNILTEEGFLNNPQN